ncbi:hypothetical protein DOJK_00552 [Patescibacteria group bacterium]|nr:hypothetical protein DOJK_00552 [Patescibacteria group bacterium]
MLQKTNQLIQNILNNITIILIAVICFIYSAYIAIYYADQIPLDLFKFRQTQTALTSYWLIKNGFSFAYETPVVGYPWSIPFEFPIYQYIVALISQYLHFSLNATGRIISYSFLVLCLIPVRSFTKKLEFSNSVFYIFAALLFSSPVYLYWGRTFMIETAAIFFSLMAIKYFIDIITDGSSLKNTLLFSVFMTLSLLQKATTGLPIIMMLGLAYLYLTFKTENSLKNILTNKKYLIAILWFGIPILITAFWTSYTDQIRALNEFGASLTSDKLKTWNFGTLEQRLAFDYLYMDVIWERVFNRNLSGTLGITILVTTFLLNTPKKIKFVAAISILMGLIPFLLFPNLHIIHDYYQAANIIFLLYAISVCIGEGLNTYSKKNTLISLLVVLIVCSNYLNFEKKYLEKIEETFTTANSQETAVSKILKKYIPEDKYFIAFGNDWSSTLAYLAERKSFTVSPKFEKYKETINNPEKFIPESHLGAVVVCPSKIPPTLNDLNKWASSKSWKMANIFGCYIAMPENKLTTPIKLTEVQCQGSIDTIDEISHNIFSITGWATVSGEKGIVPEKVYIALTKQNTEPLYFEAIQTYRPDVDTHFKQSNEMSSGFLRVIDASALSGKYNVNVIRINQGQTEICQFKKEILINAAN